MLPTPSNGFLQVAGIKVTFDPGAPKGQRVRSVTLLKTGKVLNDSASYRVAAPEGLAKGGQGYFLVFGRKALRKTTDHTVGGAVESCLAALKNVPTRPAGRVRPTGK